MGDGEFAAASDSRKQWEVKPRRVAGNNSTFQAPFLYQTTHLWILCRGLIATPVVYAGLTEPTVPIGQLLEHHAFSPEDVKVLVGAYADTLRIESCRERRATENDGRQTHH